MSDPLQPHLDRIAGTRTAEDAIHDAFFQEARRYADAHLAPAVQRTVRPTEIANAAIHSAIRAARRAAEPLSENEFRSLVFTITMRKAAAAARVTTSPVRDANRTRPLVEAEVAAAADATTPLAVLSARETAQQITEWILEEADDTKRIVKFFGVIHQEDAAQIHSILVGLAETHPDLVLRVPAVRTIQLLLRDTAKQIRARFDSP
ncbi:MAG: hypothetical protein U0804_01485 [Gemmataceae bacterium]